MVDGNLVDGLMVSKKHIDGKCEHYILSCQMRRPFDGSTEKDLGLLDLIAFDLWGLSRVQLAGGKVYLMIIIDAGTSFKHGVYLLDKSDATILTYLWSTLGMLSLTTSTYSMIVLYHISHPSLLISS